MLVKSFLLLADTPRSKEKTSGPTLRLQPPVEMCQIRWVWAQAAFQPQRPQGKALCSARRLTAAPQAGEGRWPWHFLSKQHSVLKSHKNKSMEKMHASLYSPTFSSSANCNLRTQQSSGTWRPFSLRFQIHQKAVMQTQSCGEKHHQSSTTCPGKNEIAISYSEGQKGIGRS